MSNRGVGEGGEAADLVDGSHGGIHMCSKVGWEKGLAEGTREAGGGKEQGGGASRGRQRGGKLTWLMEAMRVRTRGQSCAATRCRVYIAVTWRATSSRIKKSTSCWLASSREESAWHAHRNHGSKMSLPTALVEAKGLAEILTIGQDDDDGLA